MKPRAASEGQFLQPSKRVCPFNFRIHVRVVSSFRRPPLFNPAVYDGRWPREVRVADAAIPAQALEIQGRRKYNGMIA